MSKPEDDPSTPSAEFAAMAPVFEMMADTHAGSEALRQGAAVYIPQHAREPAEAYGERVGSTIAYPFVRQCVDELSGRAFARPPVVGDIADESPWRGFLEDIDINKRKADAFLRRWFRAGLLFGAGWLLIETPAGQAPRWRLLDPRALFFLSLDDRGVIAEARFRQVVVERNGFAEVDIEEIVRLTPGKREVYREDRNVWTIHATDDGPQRVPLVPFFPEREGPLLAAAPLLELAELQIAHMNRLSDLMTILKVASFPILSVQSADAGYGEGDEVSIGPMTLLNLDPESKAEYVEHSGAAIERLQAAIKALEDQASTFIGKHARRRPSVETATARTIDARESSSALQGWIMGFNEALADALALTAELWGLDHRPTVAISSDVLSPEGDAATLVRLRELGEISRVGLLTELKGRGLLSQSFDVSGDAAALAGEEPLFRTKPADGHAHP